MPRATTRASDPDRVEVVTSVRRRPVAAQRETPGRRRGLRSRDDRLVYCAQVGDRSQPLIQREATEDRGRPGSYPR